MVGSRQICRPHRSTRRRQRSTLHSFGGQRAAARPVAQNPKRRQLRPGADRSSSSSSSKGSISPPACDVPQHLQHHPLSSLGKQQPVRPFAPNASVSSWRSTADTVQRTGSSSDSSLLVGYIGGSGYASAASHAQLRRRTMNNRPQAKPLNPSRQPRSMWQLTNRMCVGPSSNTDAALPREQCESDSDESSSDARGPSRNAARLTVSPARAGLAAHGYSSRGAAYNNCDHRRSASAGMLPGRKKAAVAQVSWGRPCSGGAIQESTERQCKAHVETRAGSDSSLSAEEASGSTAFRQGSTTRLSPNESEKALRERIAELKRGLASRVNARR
mmetsp:Transcript_43998/g.87301  ORF Transcript_43998/g.87301 Transcript_43998/m.87301 type:complete len:330 (+) Transcript_43998:353-1342(+)